MREAVETEPGAAQMLERGEVNTSTSNLLAAQALLEDPAELFSDLQRYRKKYNKEKEIPVAATGEGPAGTEASGLWEQLDQQNFADDYRTMLQDALQETETISLEQAESHLDVKQLQLVHKQLRLAGNLQNRQEYFLPMYLGDQLAGVHLTLQQGTGETSGCGYPGRCGRRTAGSAFTGQRRTHRRLSRRKYHGRGYETGKDLRYIP